MDESAIENGAPAETVLQQQLTEAHRSLTEALAGGKPKLKVLRQAAEQAVPRLAEVLTLLTSRLAPTEADFQLAAARQEAADLRGQLENAGRQVQASQAGCAAAKAELQEALTKVTAIDQDLDDPFGKYQEEKNKNQALFNQLAERDRELESARAQLSELEALRAELAAEQAKQAHTTQEWHQQREALQADLDAAKAYSIAQREAHSAAVQHWAAEVSQWQTAHDRVVAERDTLFEERSRAEARLRHQEVEIRQRLSRELGPLLVMLSALAGQEPSQEPVSPRRPMEALKRVLRSLVGAAVEPFPASPSDQALLLNVDHESMEALLAHYDWEPAQPFAGGRRECPFRVVTRGWRAGDLVLAKAVLVPILDDASAE